MDRLANELKRLKRHEKLLSDHDMHSELPPRLFNQKSAFLSRLIERNEKKIKHIKLFNKTLGKLGFVW